MSRTLLAGLAALALVAASAPAGAQPQDRVGQTHRGGHQGWGQDDRPAGHHWQRGQRMGYNDWHSAPPVDYRAHHLRHPPKGYEWRERNGQYALGAVATGLIASIVPQSGR